MTVTTGVSGINITAFKEACYSMMNENVDLIRKITITDGTGMITDSNSTTTSIVCRIEPQNDRNRILDEFGQVITGESIGFFKPTYSGLIIQPDDLIKQGTVTYRVQKVFKYAHIGTNAIYIKASLKVI